MLDDQCNDELKIIFDSFEASILSLDEINVNACTRNFKYIEMLSNKAKKVGINFDYHELDEINDYEVNLQSITENLTFWNFYE